MPPPQTVVQREVMSWADSYWLRLPGDNLITWLFSGAKELSYEQLVHFVEDKFLPLPRFTQRALWSCPGQWQWQQVGSIEMRHHVQCIQRNSVLTERQRNQIWARWAEQPMSLDRPLWEMLLLQEPGQFTLGFRVHHALCDGKGMMELLLQIQPHRQQAQRMWSLVHAIHHGPQLAWQSSVMLWSDVVDSPVPSLFHLSTPMASRSIAYLQQPWPLEQLKRVGKFFGGGTVNDVALALLSGALSRALSCQGLSKEQKIHVLVPLLRSEPPHTQWWPHNSVTSGVCQIPLGRQHFAQRLQQVRGSTAGLKSHIVPALMERASLMLGTLPQDWITAMVQQFSRQITCIVSNVRGVPETLEFAGRPIERMAWFGPRFGYVALQVPMVSYKGALQLGVVLDERIPIQPEDLCDLLQQEYEQVCQDIDLMP